MKCMYCDFISIDGCTWKLDHSSGDATERINQGFGMLLLCYSQFKYIYPFAFLLLLSLVQQLRLLKYFVMFDRELLSNSGKHKYN